MKVGTTSLMIILIQQLMSLESVSFSGSRWNFSVEEGEEKKDEEEETAEEEEQQGKERYWEVKQVKPRLT